MAKFRREAFGYLHLRLIEKLSVVSPKVSGSAVRQRFALADPKTG